MQRVAELGKVFCKSGLAQMGAVPMAEMLHPSNRELLVLESKRRLKRGSDGSSEFARAVFDHAAVWISHEVPGVFPDIAARAARPGPAGSFLLAVNGHPVAWTDPHGAWIDWLEPH